MQKAIQFPCPIKQIAPNAISFEMDEMQGPFFAQDAIEQLAGFLSEVEQDRLAEDILSFAQTEAMKRSIVIVPVRKAISPERIYDKG